MLPPPGALPPPSLRDERHCTGDEAQAANPEGHPRYGPGCVRVGRDLEEETGYGSISPRRRSFSRPRDQSSPLLPGPLLSLPGPLLSPSPSSATAGAVAVADAGDGVLEASGTAGCC